MSEDIKRGLKLILESNSNYENASKTASILQKNESSWNNHINGPVSLEELHILRHSLIAFARKELCLGLHNFFELLSCHERWFASFILKKGGRVKF